MFVEGRPKDWRAAIKDHLGSSADGAGSRPLCYVGGASDGRCHTPKHRLRADTLPRVSATVRYAIAPKPDTYRLRFFRR